MISSATFAVVLRKEAIKSPAIDCHDTAWEYLLQRLDMRMRDTGAPIMIIHDNGSTNAKLRTLVRRFRRVSWGGGQPHATPLLIEDPMPRDSQHSYFIQLADLVAHSATRRVIPARGRGYSICSDEMWNEIGTARLVKVNHRRTDAIVLWPLEYRTVRPLSSAAWSMEELIRALHPDSELPGAEDSDGGS